MTFKDYWKNLTSEQRESYAANAETTVLTIDRKYLNGKNMPRRSKVAKLIAATNGAVSREELLEHFYPTEQQGTAA